MNENISVYMVLAGIVDFAAEATKLEGKLVDIEKRIAQVEKKRQAFQYEEKTPANVQEDDKQKLEKFSSEKESTVHALEDFRKLLENMSLEA